MPLGKCISLMYFVCQFWCRMDSQVLLTLASMQLSPCKVFINCWLVCLVHLCARAASPDTRWVNPAHCLGRATICPGDRVTLTTPCCRTSLDQQVICLHSDAFTQQARQTQASHLWCVREILLANRLGVAALSFPSCCGASPHPPVLP